MTRPLVLTGLVLSLACLGPATALAAPSFEKERVGPVPTESNLSRDQALAVLVEGEALLETEDVAGGLAKMLAAYIALEQIDGAEARGVKELRSWLVKALETVELMDEANTIRARGSYIDHPLSVMPSTWFQVAAGPPPNMSIDDAAKMTEQALDLLTQGKIEGLAMLLQAYEVIETESGAESEDAKIVRSFLVGLLETGGFVDEAAQLRARGSVAEATAEDRDIYAATWLRILEAEAAGASPLSGISGSNLKNDSSASNDSSVDSSNYDDSDDDEYRPRNFQKGSIKPSVLIDVGLGTFQPEYGRKGLLWSAGLELHWSLFWVKFFGMQLGGGGSFGRNRDKRWMADAHAELRLAFDFDKVFIRPEFGGGYDQLAGGKETIAVAYHVAPAGYYHFGGTLGVNFAERFGLYGRAVRLNRADPLMRNETRVRGGFTLGLDDASVDLAVVFTDYDPRETLPGAWSLTGNVGIRI